MKRMPQQIILICLFCVGLQSLAHASLRKVWASGNAPQVFVVSWKPNTPSCDVRYISGMEVKRISTNQALVGIALIPDSGKLAVLTRVENPDTSGRPIEVIPENFNLFKVTYKGLSVLRRMDAAKMAKSMERRQRVAAGLSGFGSGFSQTTATGTATYSDGSTASYQVTTPDTQAQSDAISRGQANIRGAQSRGAVLIGEELKRNTLEPGQHVMGRLFFPKQKPSENLLVRVEIGTIRYEFPFHLAGKHDAPSAQSTAQKEATHPQQQTTSNSVDSVPQATPTESVQNVASCRKGAEQGDPSAESCLGTSYANGDGVPQDYGQAALWYRKAAEQGDSWAEFSLGWLYDNGKGVPHDDMQAAAWYRAAAEQGEAGAQAILGSLYEAGDGVPQNYAESYFWLDLAAAQMHGTIKESTVKRRDDAAAKLTPADLSKAQQRAAEWFAAHPKRPQ
jgi:TPR repeat protein